MSAALSSFPLLIFSFPSSLFSSLVRGGRWRAARAGLGEQSMWPCMEKRRGRGAGAEQGVGVRRGERQARRGRPSGERSGGSEGESGGMRTATWRWRERRSSSSFFTGTSSSCSTSSSVA